MVLSHRFDEGRTIPYRTPLRSPSTSEANGPRSGSTALTTAIASTNSPRPLWLGEEFSDAQRALQSYQRNYCRR
jgi:hypothetical protein